MEDESSSQDGVDAGEGEEAVVESDVIISGVVARVEDVTEVAGVSGCKRRNGVVAVGGVEVAACTGSGAIAEVTKGVDVIGMSSVDAIVSGGHSDAVAVLREEGITSSDGGGQVGGDQAARGIQGGKGCMH